MSRPAGTLRPLQIGNIIPTTEMATMYSCMICERRFIQVITQTRLSRRLRCLMVVCGQTIIA